MAFVFGVYSHAEHGYRHAGATQVHYLEQDKAKAGLRMEAAAVVYWEVVGQTDDRGVACNEIRHMLTPAELQSEDFSHILFKRRPPLL